MLLEAAQKAYFSELKSASYQAPRRNNPLATPVDLEDHATSEYPDNIFIWTEYRRSHVSLGYKPYMDDDTYVSLLTLCLARGTELLLESLAVDETGRYPFRMQQNLLLKGIIIGLAALCLSEDTRTSYLLHHRDTLLRYVRRQRIREKGLSDASRSMERLLVRLENEVAALGGGLVDLRRGALQHWELGEVSCESTFGPWFLALRDLGEYIGPVCCNPDYHVDPFAEKPIFPALFKAFHGFANQLGLDPLNEAYAYHLLASLTGSEKLVNRPVLLRPEL
jgi:hypothetical protein